MEKVQIHANTYDIKEAKDIIWGMLFCHTKNMILALSPQKLSSSLIPLLHVLGFSLPRGRRCCLLSSSPRAFSRHPPFLFSPLSPSSLLFFFVLPLSLFLQVSHRGLFPFWFLLLDMFLPSLITRWLLLLGVASRPISVVRFAGCGDMDRGASHWLCTPGCVPVGPNGKRRHYSMHFGLAFDLGSRSACALRETKKRRCGEVVGCSGCL